MEKDSGSIEDLNSNLQSIVKEIESKHSDIVEFCYGAKQSETLVVIAKEDVDVPEFQTNIGYIVADVPEKPYGMLLSDGPEQYKDNPTLYIRSDSQNAYEYILSVCSKIGMDIEKTGNLFSSMYELTGNEGDLSLEVALGYIYRYDMEETSISELSQISGVDEEDIREQAMKAKDLRNFS